MDSVNDLLCRGFYSMAFQPIMDVRTKRHFGFEALLRGPKGTPLEHPGELFSRPGPLSDYFLSRVDMACIWAAVRTGRMLPTNTSLFINIVGSSVPCLLQKYSEFFGLLDKLKIDPRRIVLEISEKTDSAKITSISHMLYKFRESGIRIALDDVGTCSPWLYHIMCLEPDFVKVDRTFIKGINTFGIKQDLVHGLSNMLRQMEIHLIAEGVETDHEWRTIINLEVPFAQGFRLGYPLPAEKWFYEMKQDGSQILSALGFYNARAEEKNDNI